jgi:GT2 family glycosyltransferase
VELATPGPCVGGVSVPAALICEVSGLLRRATLPVSSVAAQVHRPVIVRAVTVPFAVAVCTRNRPEYLMRALDALAAQQQDFPILVVDQSDHEDRALSRRVADWSALSALRDDGRGISRSRNIAWRSLEAEWIAFMDDDCYVQPGWAVALNDAVRRHPEVSLVSGPVIEHEMPAGDYPPLTVQTVSEARVLDGPRLKPWTIGFGVSAVRRSTIEQLGGWDERLGAGSERYPGAEDMDFNYRFLRAGHLAYVTPDACVLHDQWRTPKDLPAVYESYAIGWSAFAVKQLRSGQRTDGLRLWAWGVYDLWRMSGSSVRRRSRARARIAARKLRGLTKGTWRGLRESW